MIAAHGHMPLVLTVLVLLILLACGICLSLLAYWIVKESRNA